MFVVIGVEIVENKVKDARLLFFMKFLEMVEEVFEEESY